MDLFLLYQYIVTAILLVIMINFIVNNLLFKNTSKYSLPPDIKKTNPLISILIPARNEEENIARCLNSLLKQDYDNIEILVMDDNSMDMTAEIVSDFCRKDSRVKLYRGKPLARGWLGKSYACHQLAGYARGEYLLFTDADTLHFANSVSSALACMLRYRVGALSVFARQIMVTIHERMIVPFGNFMILAFMPFFLIRRTRNPLFCTAIGQFMFFRKEVYQAIGGHKSVKGEILEDIHISKMVKRCGFRFMIFDGRDNLYCRMYHNFREVLHGYTKVLFAAFVYNLFVISLAIGSITAIYLLPFVMLLLAILFDWPAVILNLLILQIVFIMITKIILSIRFSMRAVDLLLHPLSIIYLIAIAFNSIIRARYGPGVAWKGRTYSVADDDELRLVKDNYK